MTIRFQFCACMALAVLASGCVVQEWEESAPDLEKGNVSSPSVQEAGRLSPLEAHMKARKMVDPKDTRPVHEYTILTIPPGQEPPLPGKKPAVEVARAQASNERDNSNPQFMSTLTGLINGGEAPSASKPPAYEKSGRAMNSSTAVREVRLGHHAGKTRVVFDLNGKAGFSYTMSADKRLLTVKLTGASWDTRLNHNYFEHPYISGYKSTVQGTNTVFKLTMKRPVEFIDWAALPPESGRGHRIYFDIRPL